jgi:hypothetical protein
VVPLKKLLEKSQIINRKDNDSILTDLKKIIGSDFLSLLRHSTVWYRKLITILRNTVYRIWVRKSLCTTLENIGSDGFHLAIKVNYSLIVIGSLSKLHEKYVQCVGQRYK